MLSMCSFMLEAMRCYNTGGALSVPAMHGASISSTMVNTPLA